VQPGVHNRRVNIEPDTKDWTWVVDQPCPDCGWDPRSVSREQLADEIHENTRGWYDVLADADFAVRPAPHVWSPIEYACHVRDVHALFAERVRLMLDQDDPTFANWDQDATAVEQAYDLQDPADVGIELVERAAEVAAVYAGVEGELPFTTWDRSEALFADLDSDGSGDQLRFATIDYSDDAPVAYVGTYVELEQLAARNLRRFEGW